MRVKRSVSGIIISKLISILIFLILLSIANYLIPLISTPEYQKIVWFINDNFGFLVSMSIIFAIGEIFFALPFPFNLPAPFFSATGAVFIVALIGKIFEFIEAFTYGEVSFPFWVISIAIYPIVFLIVFIAGYATIIASFFSPGHLPPKSKEKMKKEGKAKKGNKNARTWEDVGNEFRNMVYDFFSMMRRAFNKK